jgi:hypothetical protein
MRIDVVQERSDEAGCPESHNTPEADCRRGTDTKSKYEDRNDCERPVLRELPHAVAHIPQAFRQKSIDHPTRYSTPFTTSNVLMKTLWNFGSETVSKVECTSVS